MLAPWIPLDRQLGPMAGILLGVPRNFNVNEMDVAQAPTLFQYDPRTVGI